MRLNKAEQSKADPSFWAAQWSERQIQHMFTLLLQKKPKV